MDSNESSLLFCFAVILLTVFSNLIFVRFYVFINDFKQNIGYIIISQSHFYIRYTNNTEVSQQKFCLKS